MSDEQFRVTCPNALEKYEGKWVLLHVQVEREIKPFAGKFVVRPSEDSDELNLDADVTGPVFAFEPPNTLAVC